ncbi:glutaminase [Paenibacillus sp. Soil766]|uniref:glutaminase family protein n=1 Tax=Paenibacillus sp. Soil766 TaxID=1736404 RepID=UPI0007105221|nr:glutaminase family protein [Paenibacillus sp. Soil766]KRE86297.1 glutaminase [Paenibacillus sp. Soil766]
MNTQLRPPAVPLVTIDPYFSVWSTRNLLHEENTKHWTARRHDQEERHGMVGMAVIDGTVYRFMGKLSYDEDNYDFFSEPAVMKQVSLVVKPTSTQYTFEAAGITLTLDFTSPLLLDRLDILSRPVSYVTFEAAANDGKTHDVQIYFDATGEWCVHTAVQEIEWSRVEVRDDIQSMRMGTVKQNVLGRKGDRTRIDWGYFYLAVPECDRNDTVIAPVSYRKQFAQTGRFERMEDDEDMPRPVEERTPMMACCLSLGQIGGTAVSRFVALAYDDVFSIEYFHKMLPGYWHKFHVSIEEAIRAAVDEYPQIMELCRKFNEQLIKDATAVGGSKYADVLSLAYRQAIAAHKLVEDEEGNILFFSKECDSNGCIGTVDVSYPSVPLFLLYNPELVKGMLRPIFKYAVSEDWPYEFAPHDVGRYPIANGQIYGKSIERQMPVEECGNMLIMTAAICLAEGDGDFARQNWALLTQWADYLVEFGLDPGNQLCTDDFAGHLAHNTNLSIKAIEGIGGYSLLCNMLGQADTAVRYLQTAKTMAAEWVKMADDGDHYRLTFDSPGSWSLKYNLVWDTLFDLNLFPKEVASKETRYYQKKQNRYGTPLDSRKTYTKVDWLVWAASLAEEKDEFVRLIEPVWHFLNESRSRVPLTDWYYTIDGTYQAFVNRTVVGGLFIRLMKDSSWKNRNG